MVQMAKDYFQAVRPDIVESVAPDVLEEYDGQWQELIRLAAGSNLRRSFLKTLVSLKKRAVEIDVYRISGSRHPRDEVSQAFAYTKEETVLMQTLAELVPSAAQSYEQAIQDLTLGMPRVSYKGNRNRAARSVPRDTGSACPGRRRNRATRILVREGPDASDDETKGSLYFAIERQRSHA